MARSGPVSSFVGLFGKAGEVARGVVGCGEHPALPGFALLEWREFRPAVAPFKRAPLSCETHRERNRLHGAYIRQSPARDRNRRGEDIAPAAQALRGRPADRAGGGLAEDVDMKTMARWLYEASPWGPFLSAWVVGYVVVGADGQVYLTEAGQDYLDSLDDAAAFARTAAFITCTAMSPAIPFRPRPKQRYAPLALAALAVALFGFAATWAFVTWQSSEPDPSHVPSPPIEVIDGDTVRFNGAVYRLVGFDTPERGDKARCDDERRRAETATTRLRSLIASADTRLTRVACSCRPGQEGTRNCNYGRLCGSLSVGGRDVGQILISEGLAHSYICGATSCPQGRRWCDGR
jgi:endonuclease YncB( thermonuclease family)